VLLGGQDARAQTATAGVAAAGEFEDAETSTYEWRQTHTTAEWLEILQTHSDHQALPVEQRKRLLDAIGEAIDSLGGSFEMPYDAILVTAQRR
jgi:hypothetical protein